MHQICLEDEVDVSPRSAKRLMRKNRSSFLSFLSVEIIFDGRFVSCFNSIRYKMYSLLMIKVVFEKVASDRNRLYLIDIHCSAMIVNFKKFPNSNFFQTRNQKIHPISQCHFVANFLLAR